MSRLSFVAAFLLLAAVPAYAQQLYAAVLPSSRIVPVGTPATAFATIINAGSTLATGCSIAPTASVPAAFTYQTTDPNTNQVTGAPNTPVDIPPGGSQTFVIALTPTTEFTAQNGILVQFNFACSNTMPAPSVPGLNTLALQRDFCGCTPAIIPIMVTPTHDGIVNIPGLSGTGVAAIAAMNIGGGAGCCRVGVGTHAPNVTLWICSTDPTTGACIRPPEQGATDWEPRSVPATFSVFAQSSGKVPFDPVVNRIAVDFFDKNALFQSLFGSTSVAVRTQP